VPAFDPLTAQERALRLIASALYTGSLPHAFLFTGHDGTGKRAAGLVFAMAANCMNPPQSANGPTAAAPPLTQYLRSCGQCRSCRKITSGHHPDIHVVEPSGKLIKVDQVRALGRKMALKPYEAGTRVVVIAGAETLNPEAGNTLLKTLEEPPDRTVFVLTAPQTADLLPTIVSRCRHIRFAPIPREMLRHFLGDRYGLDPITADIVAAMADGSPTKAGRMAETGWSEHRKSIIHRMEAASSPGEALILSESISRNKEHLFETLAVMQSWFRDLIVSRSTPENIINRDLADKIDEHGARRRISSLTSKINAITRAQQDIHANANVRLTLDALMLSLATKD
jgi:DNA polymerase III subunit delta'